MIKETFIIFILALNRLIFRCNTNGDWRGWQKRLFCSCVTCVSYIICVICVTCVTCVTCVICVTCVTCVLQPSSWNKLSWRKGCQCKLSTELQLTLSFSKFIAKLFRSFTIWFQRKRNHTIVSWLEDKSLFISEISPKTERGKCAFARFCFRDIAIRISCDGV